MKRGKDILDGGPHQVVLSALYAPGQQVPQEGLSAHIVPVPILHIATNCIVWLH